MPAGEAVKRVFKKREGIVSRLSCIPATAAPLLVSRASFEVAWQGTQVGARACAAVSLPPSCFLQVWPYSSGEEGTPIKIALLISRLTKPWQHLYDLHLDNFLQT